jgi:hypothetical protein
MLVEVRPRAGAQAIPALRDVPARPGGRRIEVNANATSSIERWSLLVTDAYRKQLATGIESGQLDDRPESSNVWRLSHGRDHEAGTCQPQLNWRTVEGR